MLGQRDIELLAPASSLEGGLVALSAGADAIYVGAPQYGARSAAGVSIGEIRSLCTAAHDYAARVYVALNTILTDSQLSHAVTLAHQLYEVGADALIIQDLGLLTQELPPIPLHASTQCHNNSLGQLRMLSELGFEQVVLPREWSLRDIESVRDKVPVRLEAFIHGALCVSYSGRCFISEALSHRSANRGQCAQYCRMTYDLVDAQGRKLRQGEHLLSLRDLNRTEIVERMIDAGITSFKIEGRLKAISYIRNVTAHYRKVLDEILEHRGNQFRRPSWGTSVYTFTPQPEATFARPFTSYNTPLGTPIATDSITPCSNKSLGQPIGNVFRCKERELEIDLLSNDVELANGDGIVGYSAVKELQGAQINQVISDGLSRRRLRLSQPLDIPQGNTLWRNHNHQLESLLSRSDASVRTMPVRLYLKATTDRLTLQITLIDDPDLSISIGKVITLQHAQKDNTSHLEHTLAKLGETPYRAAEVTMDLGGLFVPPSILTELRREACAELQALCQSAVLQRRSEIGAELQELRVRTLSQQTTSSTRERYELPEQLDFTYNVANKSALRLYRQLGVSGPIAPALEIKRPEGSIPVMFTRHCLRHQLGYCTRGHRQPPFTLPLYLVRGSQRLRVETDCKHCMMTLWLDK